MIDPQLGLAIVFNGCIYNYRELRSELIGEGLSLLLAGRHRGHSQSLCGVGSALRRAFQRHVCLRDLGAQFRPRGAGARPARHQAALLLPKLPAGFASPRHCRRLLAAGGVDTTIDPAALHHYMSWHAVVPPPMTIIKGVRKLAPATICIIEPDGKRREETFWQLEVGPQAADRGMTEADWRDAVRAHARQIGRAPPHRRRAGRRSAVRRARQFASGGAARRAGTERAENIFRRLRESRRRRRRRISLFGY